MAKQDQPTALPPRESPAMVMKTLATAALCGKHLRGYRTHNPSFERKKHHFDHFLPLLH